MDLDRHERPAKSEPERTDRGTLAWIDGPFPQSRRHGSDGVTGRFAIRTATVIDVPECLVAPRALALGGAGHVRHPPA